MIRDELIALAGKAKRELALRGGARRALFVVSVLAAAAGLAVALDWALRPDALGRLFLSLALLAGTCAGTAWAALPLLRPPGEFDAAFFVTGELGLSDALPSAVWFATNGVPGGESEELARICAERSLEEVTPREVTRAVARVDMRHGALAAAFCALGWLGFVLGLPEGASTGVLRLVWPFGGPPWPTRTRIEEVVSDGFAARGEPFEVRVRGAGSLPQAGEVEFVWADGCAEVRAEPSPEVCGVYSAVLPSLPADVRFRAELGDAQTAWLHARAVERPRVLSAEVEVSPPAYTGVPRSMRAVVGGEVLAPGGSAFLFRFVVSPAPETAHARVSFAPGEETPLPVTLDPSRGELESRLRLDRSGVFTLDVRASGLGLKSPLRLALRARKDEPPRVKMLRPRERVLDLLEGAKVELSFEASDDYAVIELSLEGTVDEAKRERSVWRGKERIVSRSVSLSPLDFDARAGQVLTARVRALDAKGQSGTGRELVLRVRTREEILRLVALARKEARKRVERLIASLESDVTRGRKPPLMGRARSCEEISSALDGLSASMAMNGVGEEAERSAARRARSFVGGAGSKLRNGSSDPRFALEDLKRALAEMESWDETKDLATEVERLLKEQTSLMRRTASGEELAPVQKTLAIRAEKLLARMHELQPKLDGEDPLAAARVREAAQAGLRASSSMRRAWRELERAHVGRALSFQEEAIDALKRTLQALRARATLDPARAARKLRERAEALRELIKAQEALLAGTRAGATPPAELARKETGLKAGTEEETRHLLELARQAGSLDASDAASETAQAAGRMGSAADYLARAMTEAASGEERRAIERLKRALKSVEKAVTSCALAQALTLKKDLDALKAEQARIRRAAKALPHGDELARAGKLRCVELARDETRLETRTKKLARGIEHFPVFAWALDEVGKGMVNVAGRLDEHEPGEETLTAARRVEEGLEELIAALSRAADAARAGAAGGGGGGGPGDLGPSAEELAFIKSRQEKINARADGASSDLEDARPDAFAEFSSAEKNLARLLDGWGRPLSEGPRKEVGRVVGMMGELSGVFALGGGERMKPLGRQIVETLDSWLRSARPAGGAGKARAKLRPGGAKSSAAAAGTPSSPMNESVAAPAPGNIRGRGRAAVVLGEGAEWGRLPPSSVSALRRFLAEAFPLEYKALVKEYFRSLSRSENE